MAYTVPHTWVPGDFLRASWLNYTTTDLVDHEARIVTLETAGGGDALTTDGLDQFAATTSAELKTVISDETGSGALVFATSPTLVTPALGTPSAVVLTNATGLPLTTGITGDLALSNLAPSAAASKLLGRGDSGAGDWEPVTLGTNLAMSGATLNATGGSALSLAQNRLAGRGASSGTGDAEAITLGSGLVLTGTSLAATSGVAGDVTVAKAGSAIGTRARINFLDGTNVTITATDDAGNNEVDVSIAATGGGGGLVLLEQHTASASATLDFTTFISSTYETYIFHMLDVLPATSTADLWIRMGTGGGPSWDSGTNYTWAFFQHSQLPNTATLGASSEAKIKIAHSLSTSATNGASGEIRFYNPQSTAVHKRLIAHLTSVDSSGNFADAIVSGQYVSTTAVTGVQFLFSSGNITSGTIRVYGLVKI